MGSIQRVNVLVEFDFFTFKKFTKKKGRMQNSLKNVAFLSELSNTKCCDEMNLTEAPVLFYRGKKATDFSSANCVYYKEILQYAHDGKKNSNVLCFSKVGLMLNSQ